MLKYIFSLFILVLFSACNTTSSTDEVNESVSGAEPIPVITDDTTVNSSVAKVPHHKSSIPMLVILISYNNQVISSSDSSWSDKMFGENTHQLNNYYEEVSNKQFKFDKAYESYGTTNDGVISVKLNKNHPNADIDSSFFSSKMYPDLASALRFADDYINFSNYDADGNGHITPDELILTFIIAGYEDAYEGWHVTNGVWAHQYCLENSLIVPVLDSVDLMSCQYKGNFAMFGEKHNHTNPHDATIGIIAHELGHSTFSLPDLYNTTENYGGIGYFGLMGAGTWAVQDNNEYAGNTPTHFSAWSKEYMGWITPQEQTGYSVLYATSSSNYNVIKIPISANNYYLLENRDNSGYDKGLFSLTGIFRGGIAIWHVNENKLTESNFETNNVNADTQNKGVDLIEASNATLDTVQDSGGDARALFYHPNVSSFDTKITNISSPGLQMSLTIN